MQFIQKDSWKSGLLVVARADKKFRADLMKDANCELGRGRVVHGHSDHSAIRTAEKRRYPCAGVWSPQNNPITFIHLAGIELAGKAESSCGNFSVGPARDSIATGFGISLFSS